MGTMGRRAVAALAAALLATGLMGAPARAGGDLPVPYTFLVSAVLGGTRVDASPPGANEWSCRPSAEHPRPVVLVHGLLGNRNTNWQTYAPLLKNNGYCVYSLTYGVPKGTPVGLDQFGGLTRMQDSAVQLKAFVQRVLRSTGAREVDIVGHSEGTVVPQYYVKFLGGAKYVQNYVAIAPLWHGTRIANTATVVAKLFGLDPDSLPVCASCAQFAPGSPFMTKMRTGRIAVRGVHYTNIVTKYDELVAPYTSGIQRGMHNYVLQDSCAEDYSEHFEVVASPVAAQIVLNTLDPAHPKPVPCRLVLPFVGP